MPTSPTLQPGVNYSGEYLPIRFRAGDSFKFTSTFTLDTGVTISSAAVTVYDTNGTAQSGITETADLVGDVVDWGLLDEAETATLTAGSDYTYVFRIVLSNGTQRTVYYGPLMVDPVSGAPIE